MMARRELASFARSNTDFLSHRHTSVASPHRPLLLDSSSLHANIISHNQYINHFIKSGSLDSALRLFDEMPVRDVVTWNLLISGHARHGHPNQALSMYVDMVHRGTPESPSTFSTILSLCCSAGFHRQGVQVHCRAVAFGLTSNMFVGTSLIDLYLHMGHHNAALNLFHDFPKRNLASWNVILRGFSAVGLSGGLLELFNDMKSDGVEPNDVTLCYMMRGCSSGRLLAEGKQLHCHMLKMGLSESNVFVKNALIDLYSACGCLLDARRSIEAIPASDVISLNPIVAVYAESGLLVEAVAALTQILLGGKTPSSRSFLGFLSWCSGVEDLTLGQQIHCHALKLGFAHGNVHVQSALINMYGKCSAIGSSVRFFEGVPERSLECCNSLMSSLLYCGFAEDAIEMFGFMMDEGVRFDGFTLTVVLKSMSDSASPTCFGSCSSLHGYAVRSGLELDAIVACSLINVYSRCGRVDLSRRVFDQLPTPNVVCFTTIIKGYAWNGMGARAVEMLAAMVGRGVRPDAVTTLCVLAGCSHCGLVEEGRAVYQSMRRVYEISPDHRHCSCLVDLLGRAGLVEEAEERLRDEPSCRGYHVAWSSLLRSCLAHGNETVGRRAARVLTELAPDDSAAHFQAMNFFAEIGDVDAANRARETAMGLKIRREIGSSFIEG